MARRQRNIEAFTDKRGVVHPIRRSSGYDDEKTGSTDFDWRDWAAEEREQRQDEERELKKEYARYHPEAGKSLATFVRQRGGFRYDGIHDGEIDRLRKAETGTTGLVSLDKGKGLTFKRGRGLKPDRMLEAAIEAGVVSPDTSLSRFMDDVEMSATKRNPFPTATVEKAWQAWRKAEKAKSPKAQALETKFVKVYMASQKKNPERTIKHDSTGEVAPAHRVGTTRTGHVIYQYVHGWRPMFSYRQDKDGNWIAKTPRPKRRKNFTIKAAGRLKVGNPGVQRVRRLRARTAKQERISPELGAKAHAQSERAFKQWAVARDRRVGKAIVSGRKWPKFGKQNPPATLKVGNPRQRMGSTHKQFSVKGKVRTVKVVFVPSSYYPGWNVDGSHFIEDKTHARRYAKWIADGAEHKQNPPTTLKLEGVDYNVVTWETAADMDAKGHKNVARAMRENKAVAQVGLLRPAGKTLYHVMLFDNGRHSKIISLGRVKNPGEAKSIRKWALMAWRGDGRYRKADAIKTYASLAAAEKAAEKAYKAGDPRNLVVRDLNYMLNPAKANGLRKFRRMEKLMDQRKKSSSSKHTPHAGSKYDIYPDYFKKTSADLRKREKREAAKPGHYKRLAAGEAKYARRKNISIKVGGKTRFKASKKGVSIGGRVQLKANPGQKRVQRLYRAAVKASHGSFVGGETPAAKAKIRRAAQAGRKLTLKRRATGKENPTRIVFNRLLGGWYVVHGPHQTPIAGRFSSREEAKAHMAAQQAARDQRGLPKHRRNGIFETFTGRKATRQTALNAPDGTPKRLDKLGKLIGLYAENGTIKPRVPVWLCSDSKGKLHLATSAARLIDGGPQSFGEVKKIEYETTKKHLDGKPTIYFHHFGEEGGKRPTLHADGKGGLKLRGGSYKIRAEGIRD